MLVEGAVKIILEAYDDAERPGLLETPKRVAAMYHELLTPKDFDFTTFEADGYDQMIVQNGIEFFSLCEHHMVPFLGTVSIGYIPDKHLVGLSKMSRAVEFFARRLQVQERMTAQIADYIDKKLAPKGVGVVVRARHLCQEMRGVKKRDVETVTSALRGAMLDKQSAREEFLFLCNGKF